MATDPFTYSNGELEAVAGGNWTKLRTGGQTANVDTNVLKGNTNFDAPYRWLTTFSSAAVYAEAVMSTLASGGECAVIINVHTATDGSRSYNIFEVTESGGSYNLLIGKIVAGTFTSLATKTGVSISAGNTIRIENDGAGNLSAYIAGALVTGWTGTPATTDNDTRFGVGIMPSSGAADRMNDWGGGDLAPSGVTGAHVTNSSTINAGSVASTDLPAVSTLAARLRLPRVTRFRLEAAIPVQTFVIDDSAPLTGAAVIATLRLPQRRRFSIAALLAGAAPPAVLTAAQGVSGATVTNSSTLNAGAVGLGVDGATVTNGSTLNAGSVGLQVSGATVTNSSTLNAGSVGLHVSGATLANSSTLNAGTVSADGDLSGATVTNSSTLNAGSVGLQVSGATIANSSTLNAGSIGPQVSGATVTNSSTLNAGTVGLAVEGATITNSSTLNAGTVTADGGLSGATVTNTSTLNAGSVGLQVSGATVTNSSTLNPGTVTDPGTLAGVHYTNSSTINAGSVGVEVLGAHVTNVSTLNAGAIGSVTITGSTLLNSSELFAGTVGLVVSGAFYTNTSTLRAGTVANAGAAHILPALLRRVVQISVHRTVQELS